MATWSALWRHGVGTSGIVATCPSMCATVEGVVSVLWCCSDTPCHTWSYGWRGMLILVV
jgi:hypothetical protein